MVVNTRRGLRRCYLPVTNERAVVIEIFSNEVSVNTMKIFRENEA
jgi:hypothetical protein